MDDWDETTDDLAAEAGHSEREYTKLQARHTDAGYREGINVGKLSTLQTGFNDGFARYGAPAGRRLGLARGTAGAILAWLLQRPDSAAALIEEARTLVRDLGRLAVEDVAERDSAAAQHAAEHGEALEAAMERLGAPQPKPPLPELEVRLTSLVTQCGAAST
jgi:hypothetical protein